MKPSTKEIKAAVKLHAQVRDIRAVMEKARLQNLTQNM